MAQQHGSAEAVWRERLERFRPGELTVGEFCQREGVSPASFHAWKRRLKLVGDRSAAAERRGPVVSVGEVSPLFVPVSLKAAAAASEVRIVLPGGAVVHLPADADERLLRCCIRAAAEPERGEAQPC